MPTYCTRDSICVNDNIWDRQLECEQLMFTKASSCVDRLLTEHRSPIVVVAVCSGFIRECVGVHSTRLQVLLIRVSLNV